MRAKVFYMEAARHAKLDTQQLEDLKSLVMIDLLHFFNSFCCSYAAVVWRKKWYISLIPSTLCRMFHFQSHCFHFAICYKEFGSKSKYVLLKITCTCLTKEKKKQIFLQHVIYQVLWTKDGEGCLNSWPFSYDRNLEATWMLPKQRTSIGWHPFQIQTIWKDAKEIWAMRD